MRKRAPLQPMPRHCEGNGGGNETWIRPLKIRVNSTVSDLIYIHDWYVMVCRKRNTATKRVACNLKLIRTDNNLKYSDNDPRLKARHVRRVASGAIS